MRALRRHGALRPSSFGAAVGAPYQRLFIMAAPPQKNNPAAFLKQVLGRPVVVKLNSGVDYRGAAPAVPRAPHRPTELSRPPTQACWRAWTGS